MRDDRGFLAIWSDVPDDRETDYLHWLTREHTQERLGVPGFLAARVFRARMPDLRRYFILYELESPRVMGSSGYLARLNDPTPWSQRIMPILGNFARGGGRWLARAGLGEGAAVAPQIIPADRLDDALRRAPGLARYDRIASVSVLAVDRESSEIQTDEKAMRSGDRSFDAMLLVEAVDERALAPVLDAFGVERVSTYDQIFALREGGML